MVAICRFEKKTLSEMEIYPVDMRFGHPPSQRGRPVLADADLGKIILERVERLSEACGTQVVLRDGRGIIRGT